MRRLILLAGVLGSLVFAGSASAAVSSTSITNPADPYFGFYSDTGGAGQNLTVSGASSGGQTGDGVDILCYADNGSTGGVVDTVKTGVPIGAGGRFTTSVPLSDFAQPGDGSSASGSTSTPCRLRAVPAGTTPTSGLSAFEGPRIAIGYLNHFFTSGGSGLYDYYLYAPGLTAAEDLASFGGGGLDDSYVFDPNVFGQFDVYGFYWNDWEDSPSVSNPRTPGVVVDGHPAYAPYWEHHINPGAPGFEPVVIDSVSQNRSTGELAVTETDPLGRCPTDQSSPDSASCTRFISTGVQLERTMVVADDGHMIYVLDSYSSTDGHAHDLSLLLENDQHFGRPDTASVSYDPTLAFVFPGSSTWKTYPPGSAVSVPPSAPASIYIEEAGSPDGTTSTGRGAITYAQPPSGQFAFAPPDPNDPSSENFDAPEQLVVPASGSVRVRFAYSTEFTQAAVDRDALKAQDVFLPPQLTIASPAQGATIKSGSAEVSGTAVAGSGVKSVTVDGNTVSVTSAGAFSTWVRLHGGQNTITVTFTSKGGKVVTKTLVTSLRVSATTGAASRITSSAATLAGAVLTGGQKVSWYFEYGRGGFGSRTASRNLRGSGIPSKVSVRIGHLRAGTRYRYRLVITCGGRTARGASRTFTTRSRPRHRGRR